MDTSENKVISRIVQIRHIKKLTHKDVASGMGIAESTYSRIESGVITLSYDHLAKIACVFKMPVIDVLTYPKIFTEQNPEHKTPRVTLQIELEDNNITVDVLKLAFGDRILEIKNM